jgi:hypothetical protein
MIFIRRSWHNYTSWIAGPTTILHSIYAGS